MKTILHFFLLSEMNMVICLAVSAQVSLAQIQDKIAGEYTQSKRNNRTGKALVTGRLFDVETKDPLKTASAKIGEMVVKADTNGYFSLKVKPGDYITTGLCYPYHRVVTKPIKIKAGETVFIKYRLLIDKTPLE